MAAHPRGGGSLGELEGMAGAGETSEPPLDLGSWAGSGARPTVQTENEMIACPRSGHVEQTNRFLLLHQLLALLGCLKVHGPPVAGTTGQRAALSIRDNL